MRKDSLVIVDIQLTYLSIAILSFEPFYRGAHGWTPPFPVEPYPPLDVEKEHNFTHSPEITPSLHPK